MSELGNFVLPIPTLLTPTAEGRLDKDRAAELADRLRRLQLARARAAVEIRDYLVRSAP